jgi:hypothetical protein
MYSPAVEVLYFLSLPMVIHWLIVCCILVKVSESVTKIVLNITLCIQINLKVQEQLQAAASFSTGIKSCF